MTSRLFIAGMLLGVPLGAQTLTGYTMKSADRERSVEIDVVSRPNAKEADAHSRFLSQQPHMSGTPAQARTRDYVVAQMKSRAMDAPVGASKLERPRSTAR